MTDESTSAQTLIAAYKACARPSAAAERQLWATLAAAERAAPARPRRPAPSRAPWFALAAGLLLFAAWQLDLLGLLASGHVLKDRGQQAAYDARGGRPEAATAREQATGDAGEPADAREQGTAGARGSQPAIDGAHGSQPEREQGIDGASGSQPAPDGARGSQPGTGDAREQGTDGARGSQHAIDGARGSQPAAGSDKHAAGDARPRRTPGSRSQARDDGDPVLAEMVLLQQARAALRAGDPGEALELLARHAETFGRGSMAEEREALRVLALCASGSAAGGSAAAAAFLRAHPRSTYAARVVDSCPQGQEPKDTSSMD